MALFDEVNPAHISLAIEEFKTKGAPAGLGPSKYYDVKIGDTLYPPKPIMAYANYYATSREPGNYFSGGENTPCFKAFERLGIEIVKKNSMNLTETYLNEFAQQSETWFAKQTWLEERYNYFKNFFTDEFLSQAEWKDFQEMGNHIHAFTGMQIAKANALGNMNLSDIEEYRKIFKYIISKKDPVDVTINNLRATEGPFHLPFFGESAISELISYAFPNDYITYNTRDIQGLHILNLDLPNIRRENFGEKYLRYNEFLKPITEQYKEIVGQKTRTTIPLELDQFFSWLYATKHANLAIKNLIENYKKRIQQNRLEDEVYKWEFIQKYQGKPNINAEDFQEEIKSIKWVNLIYGLSGGVLNHLAKEKPEELRKEFQNLFDEAKPLDERIKQWDRKINSLYKNIEGQHGHHQDERAISVYLTLHNPDQYTLYKSSYYIKFCELLGEREKGKGKKYSHYLELIDQFIQGYISKDQELIDMVKSYIPEYYDGSNHLLIAQDILYQILDKDLTTGYWIFQGNPKIYDVVSSIENNALKTWKVNAHKDKIKVGDKIILWLTGENPGCYALCEVTSEVYEGEPDPEENVYYKVKPTEVEKYPVVKLEVTHDLTDSPIGPEELDGNPLLNELKVGHQGTNFSATKEQYETLLGLIDHAGLSMEEALKSFNPLDPENYFSFLAEILQEFDLKRGDERLVFTITRRRINFTIGQRYCWNLFKNGRRGSFGVMSSKPLLPTSEFFAGSGNPPSYTYFDEIKFALDNKASIFEGIKNELNRTSRSGHYEHNNPEVENYAFNHPNFFKTQSKKMNQPINQILYGPPGTGKTYKLKTEYFQKYTTKGTSITLEKYFESVVKELSWWEVIAIALLELGKAKVNTIYENRWVKQKESLSESNTVRQTIWSQLQSHTIPECLFVNVRLRQTPFVFNKTEDSFWVVMEENLRDLAPELYGIKEQVDNFNPNPDKEIKRYQFTTFHQSFSYEDFIEGIKPIMTEIDEETKELTYTIQPGIFKQLCTDAQNDPDNRYAIFIDEINRGNISNIFGELITLIEPDKRMGASNEMSAILPYSKKKFSVPANVDIYGTMNTADRSVEALDTALRRRFSFKEIMPNAALLTTNIEGFSLSEILRKINERIEVLIDRDHTIGHSYLMEVKNMEDLKWVFKDKITPLLQEYFYGDYGKIGLVLGKGFVEFQEKKDQLFADFNYDRQDELNNGFYTLKAINNHFDMISALRQLLNIEEA